MRGLLKQRVVAVVAGSAVVVGLGAVGAVADNLIGSDDVKDQSLAKVDLGRGSVGGSELVLGSIRERKLAPRLREKINQLPLQGETPRPRHEVLTQPSGRTRRPSWTPSLR